MGALHDLIFGKQRQICPWYLCSIFNTVNWMRSLLHSPEKILNGLIKYGNTVIDVGPGQGFFTLPMARMAGDRGKVIAIDVQEKMLSILAGNAKKAGLNQTIICKLVSDSNYGFDSEIDFVLAFWMLHEVPDKKSFLNNIYKSLKPSGKFLIVEPFVHVTKKSLGETRSYCEELGFHLIDEPKIFFSRSMLLQKGK